jgi:ketosteroid isomerase-like protein
MIPRGEGLPSPSPRAAAGCNPHNRAVESSAIVAELWSRIQARDWDGVGELLAEDFVLEWPNAQIRLRGRTSFVEFNRSYPEGWSIEVLRIVAEGNTAVSEVRVPHPTVGPYYALSFLEVEGGRLTRGREYWVEERSEKPAPERARWFEPM